MPRRSQPTGRYTVGDDKRTFSSPYAAVALAQHICLKGDAATGVYVREVGTQGYVARVHRVGNAIITEKGPIRP